MYHSSSHHNTYLHNSTIIANHYGNLARTILDEVAYEKRVQPLKNTVDINSAPPTNEWIEVDGPIDVRDNFFPILEDFKILINAFPMRSVNALNNAFPMRNWNIQISAFPTRKSATAT